MGINVMVSETGLCLSRFALTALLGQCGEVEVVGSVDGGIDALEFAETHRPDVAVIGFDGADSDAITVAEKYRGLPGAGACCSPRRSPGRWCQPGLHRRDRRDGAAERARPGSSRPSAGCTTAAGFDTELTVAALGNEGCR